MKRKAKFRVGQVVRVYGVPEIKEAHRFLGYHRVSGIENLQGAFHYHFDAQRIRESRLRSLTKRERGAVAGK